MRRRAIDSSTTRRLGMAAPLPFVGRRDEMATLVAALDKAPVVVVRGPAGAGKTRLCQELLGDAAIRRSFPEPVYIRCQTSERAGAVFARAERHARRLPGSLPRALRAENLLLVIDDVHGLADVDALPALSALLPRDRAAAGRVILISRDHVPLRRDLPAATLDLAGLDEASARQLWHALEDTYGPTPRGFCDRALLCTAAMPLALRQEYARAAHGGEAGLPDGPDGPDGQHRAVLEALAVLGLPAGPAAILAITRRGKDDRQEEDASTQLAVEAALTDIVARQLIDPCSDGRFTVAEAGRAGVLSGIVVKTRIALERGAAELAARQGRGAPGTSDASLDSGALGPLAPIDRLHEEVRHLLAAGDVASARARLIACQDEPVMEWSGGAEIIGLIDAVRAASGTPELALDALHARIAARRGLVAEALEMYQTWQPSLATAAGDRSLATRASGQKPARDDSAGQAEPGQPASPAESADRDQASRDSRRGSGPGGTFDRVEGAALCFRSGDVSGARQKLEELLSSVDPTERCRAAAVLSEIALHAGEVAEAESVVAGVFARDRSIVADSVRARLHLALAAVEEHAGRLGAARAALARAAAASQMNPGVSALVEARRSLCLCREGRMSEADATLAEAERTAREIDAVTVVDEIRRCRGILALRRGDTAAATETARSLVAERRQRGDEIGALQAEIDLARILVRRGELAAAAEIVSACSASVGRRKLAAMAAELRLISALIDRAELRLPSARVELEAVIADRAASAEVHHKASTALSVVHALAGDEDRGDALCDASELADEIEDGQAAAIIALARGDSARATAMAREIAVRAERAGRMADMAEAMAFHARLLFACGDRAGASQAAASAAREAGERGLFGARVLALLVNAAVAREAGDRDAATGHAREASDLATAASLPVERFIAAEALDALACAGTATAASAPGTLATTLSEPAVAAAGRVLSDLGLTALRPYRIIGAGAAESFVADPNPDLLRLAERSLAIDAVNEVVSRAGRQIADLRRRSLLKRLLFLFGRAPGRIFSKEEIVKTVWQVDYHPLRHDAALFTNIMRIRRMLGSDGAELLRVSEDGYRFVPPKDYLYLEPAAS